MSDASPALYPVFLRLAGRRVLLVGGGPVAASKLQGLIDAGAHITLVAPEIVPEIETVARSLSPSGSAVSSNVAPDEATRPAAQPRTGANAAVIELHRRPFETTDLDGVWYVVAAAIPEVNRAVSAAAGARQLFVNAVDDPPNASVYLGGIVRRAGVTIAISTDGQAPALAGLLREGLDAVLPQELDAWMQEARAIRKTWLANRIPMEERRPLLLQALNDIYARRGIPGRTAAEVFEVVV